MSVSKRALEFLKYSKREGPTLTSKKIVEIFEANSAPVFESLIEFQTKYGGYIFYAGLAPINFSLLKGLGGYPESNYSALVEFEENYSSGPKYYFDCATTDYQMQFFLDEQGLYYEDYEVQASCFDKIVEHLAIWDEIQRMSKFEILFKDKKIDISNIDSVLKLEIIPEASDQYTLWFRNEHIYMQQKQGLTTIVVSNIYPDKLKLLML